MSGLPSQWRYSVWLWTVHHWIVRPLAPWHSDSLHDVLSLAVWEQYTSARRCRPAMIFQARTVTQALNWNILEEESYWFKFAEKCNKYRLVQQQASLTCDPAWNHLRRLLETCQNVLNHRSCTTYLTLSHCTLPYYTTMLPCISVCICRLCRTPILTDNLPYYSVVVTDHSQATRVPVIRSQMIATGTNQIRLPAQDIDDVSVASNAVRNQDHRLLPEYCLPLPSIGKYVHKLRP